MSDVRAGRNERNKALIEFRGPVLSRQTSSQFVVIKLDFSSTEAEDPNDPIRMFPVRTLPLVYTMCYLIKKPSSLRPLPHFSALPFYLYNSPF